MSEIARDYLPEGGEDLKKGKAAFLSVDLVYGRIRAYVADEYADVAPVLVGAGWHMRWPIPPVDNSRANNLITDVSEHVANLLRTVSVREEPDPVGVILYIGSGSSIDAIQRRCVEEWRSYYETPGRV
ncbi:MULTISPECIES: hypothetical protein [unclassified Streptomyces]|uniref:hypothetical protein n=1 Tax=unclassified Streptomyces TaxID=2593676 RepID=UPI0035D614EE